MKILPNFKKFLSSQGDLYQNLINILQKSLFFSFRFRMTAGILIGIVPPMLTAIWLATSRAATIIRTEANQSLELKTNVLKDKISDWEEHNILLLKTLIKYPNIISMIPEEQLPIITLINHNYKDLFFVEAYDLNGYVVARGNGKQTDTKQKNDRQWFKDIIAGKEISREAIISRSSGKPSLLFAAPIRELNNLQIGDGGLSVQKLQQQLTQLGYYQDKITGIYDNTTAAIVAEFQKKYTGLKSNGIADTTTQQLLTLAMEWPDNYINGINPPNSPTNITVTNDIKNIEKIKGVFVITTRLTELYELIGSVHLGKTGFAFLVDEKGQVLAHPDTKLISGDSITSLQDYPPVKSLLAGNNGEFSFIDEQGIKWLAFGNKLENGWGIIILQQEVEVLEKETFLWRISLIIAILSVLVVTTLTWLLTSRLIRPITQLTIAAKTISNGELTQRVNIDRQDEIGTLVNAFNRMAIELEKSFARLEFKTKEAEKSRIEAEAASKAKSLFLANMSHELRTPLNAIIGYSEILQEEIYDAETSEIIGDLETINNAGKHLLNLINDILDLSKIEAGKMNLYLETFDINTLVQDVGFTIQTLINKNANVLEINCPEYLGSMYGDATKTRQCLFNLLSNASKFTEKGLISLKISRENNKGEDWIIFSISDNGIGMNQEQVEKLFQAFNQADNSISRKYGGTGLGLAITKKFCLMMGGDISVTSELNKGSTFIIKLPAIVSVKEM